MDKIFLIFILLVLLGVGGYVYVDLHKDSVSQQDLEIKNKTVQQVSPIKVSLVRSQKDGVVRYSGDFRLPHSCYHVESNISVGDGIAHIVISTEDQQKTRSSCAFISTAYSFILLTEHAFGIPVDVNIDGNPALVNINDTDWQNPSGTLLNESIK